MIKKAVWLSYDLGIGGDYPGLYKWLDNHKAIECGNSIAFFYYQIKKTNSDELVSLITEDIEKCVRLRSGDRLYVIRLEHIEETPKIMGRFIYGSRRSNPWEGYGDSKSTESEEGI